MQWYYIQDGKRIGPVEEEELLQLAKDHILRPHNQVWNETMGDTWVDAETIEGLIPKLHVKDCEDPEPEGAAVVASVYERPDTHKKKFKLPDSVMSIVSALPYVAIIAVCYFGWQKYGDKISGSTNKGSSSKKARTQKSSTSQPATRKTHIPTADYIRRHINTYGLSVAVVKNPGDPKNSSFYVKGTIINNGDRDISSATIAIDAWTEKVSKKSWKHTFKNLHAGGNRSVDRKLFDVASDSAKYGVQYNITIDNVKFK